MTVEVVRSVARSALDRAFWLDSNGEGTVLGLLLSALIDYAHETALCALTLCCTEWISVWLRAECSPQSGALKRRLFA